MANNNTKNIKLPGELRKQPIASSVISKLNSDKRSNKRSPLDYNIPEIVKFTHDKIKNNDDIMELFPDTELAIRILVSSILSPNDMLGCKINYESPDIRIPVGTKRTITNAISDYIQSNYKLEDKLYNIIREALFTKGAYIEAIIPEASLDDVINGYNIETNVSVESYTNNYFKQTTTNFLGRNTLYFDYSYGVQAEDKVKEIKLAVTQEDLNIEITDNYSVLNLPKIIEGIGHRKTEAQLNFRHTVSREDELDNIFSNNTKLKMQDYVKVPLKEDASRKSLGKPMIMKLPTECVIPVYVANEPSKHLGYFIMLDKNGIPINSDGAMDNYNNEEIFKVNSTEGTSQFNLITKAKNALVEVTRKAPEIRDIETLYSDIVEKMIKDKLRKGNYGELVTIKENADIYRVMFMRAMRAQKTRLLFLPSELVSYFAFEYRDNGTGRSLLEKSGILFSIRSILLFTRMMANLKNSITVTNVTAELDENDVDPEGTMSKIISRTMKTRQIQLPFGITNVDDLVEWAHGVGFKFNFKSPGLPNMTVDVSETNSSKVVPDDQLDEDVRKFIYMSWGLTPEMMDAAYQVDYATTLVANNLLFAKYIKQLQNIFNPLLRKHIQKIMINDANLQADLYKTISANIEEIKKSIRDEVKSEAFKIDKFNNESIINYVINKFCTDLDIYLPEPESNEADVLNKSLDIYKENVNKYLDEILSTEVFDSKSVGTLSDEVDSLKKKMKAMLIMKWMNENNYLPEVAEFFTNDVDDRPINNILVDFVALVDKLSEPLENYAKEIVKAKKKSEKRVQKLNDKLNDTGDSGSSSYGDDSGSDDSSTDDGNTGDGENTEGDTGTDDGGTGDDTGGDTGGDDMGMDMGDFGDDMGGDSGTDDGGGEENKVGEKKELKNQLLEARIEKEKALAAKAKHNAIKAGVDPEELETNKDDEGDEGEEPTDDLGGEPDATESDSGDTGGEETNTGETNSGTDDTNNESNTEDDKNTPSGGNTSEAEGDNKEEPKEEDDNKKEPEEEKDDDTKKKEEEEKNKKDDDDDMKIKR